MPLCRAQAYHQRGINARGKGQAVQLSLIKGNLLQGHRHRAIIAFRPGHLLRGSLQCRQHGPGVLQHGCALLSMLRIGSLHLIPYAELDPLILWQIAGRHHVQPQ